MFAQNAGRTYVRQEEMLFDEVSNVRHHHVTRGLLAVLCLAAAVPSALAQQARSKDDQTVKSEHGMIGLEKEEDHGHTDHPDAQWFGDAGFGLFLHWSICSTRAMNISWPMIPGRELAKKRIDDP